jgi:hypothetical protein
VGTGGFIPGDGGVELEVDHSPVSSAEVKNEWSYTSTHLDAIMAWTGKTGFAASQEIPRIYGTRKFITAFTSARHLSLS